MEKYNMKRAKVIVLLIGFILLFWGCKSENKLLGDFIGKEKQILTNETKEIIAALGLENFEILIYAHKSINNGIVSKQTNFTDWSGTGYPPPEGPAEVEGVTPPVYKDMRNLYGRLNQRTMTANYEINSKKEITYDYFSILIIFEKINNIKKDELLGILNSHIINAERGDIINIISKEKFNKL
jgi:hypothetical protein